MRSSVFCCSVSQVLGCLSWYRVCLLVVPGLCVLVYANIIILHWDCWKHRQAATAIVMTQEGVWMGKEVVPPVTLVPPSSRVRYNTTWHDLTLPLLTCRPKGHLGNVMGQYATLYSFSRLYNTTSIVHRDMRNALADYFPRLTLPVLKEGEFETGKWLEVTYSGHLYNYAPVEMAAAGLLGPLRFMMTGYAFEMQLFNPFKEDLRREFTFSPKIRRKAHNFLSGVKEARRGGPDPVFIGLHIRRTDYADHFKNTFGGHLPEAPYFTRAMTYYREKFPGAAVFIAASDDLQYAKTLLAKFDDTFFTPGVTAIEDLAVLSACNHSIITLGSFGFWSAYLAGGEVVYPLIKLQKPYRFSRAMFNAAKLASFTPLPVD